jgi:electron transport complex protein RnfC
MSFFMNSIPVPLKKNTMDVPSVRMSGVTSVTIPMQMHIGTPAKPVVKMGDLVQVGTLIAEANGEISSPIHASVSGKVAKIIDYVTANGATVPAVVITSDGEMTPCEGLAAPVVNSKQDLLDAIRNSGIVGLGGAGFPTHVKFDVDFEKLDELIINGTECEPYLTSDNHAMLERVGDIEVAIGAFKKYFGIKRIIIVVGDNKKAALENMKNLASKFDGVEVVKAPSTYSYGSEEAIIYHTTKKVLSADKLPIDLGCLVSNVTTVAAIGAYLQTGMPLVEKLVAVDGGCVKEPKSVYAPIGTSLADVFAFCGEFSEDPERVVYGGVMRGITVPDLTAPVLKNTNAVLALSAKDVKAPKESPCIRCGECTNYCPLGLAPAAIARAYQQKDVEQLEKLMVQSCMECGSCSYLCPAHRPLVQTIKLAKMLVKEANQ